MKGLIAFIALVCFTSGAFGRVLHCYPPQPILPTSRPTPITPDSRCGLCNVGRLFAVANKHAFLQCIGDKQGHIMPCAANLVFVEKKQICDYGPVTGPTKPNGGQCSNSPAQRPILCFKCLDNQKRYFPSSQGPTKFYECIGVGMALCRTCPRGVFIDKQQTCSYDQIKPSKYDSEVEEQDVIISEDQDVEEQDVEEQDVEEQDVEEQDVEEQDAEVPEEQADEYEDQDEEGSEESEGDEENEEQNAPIEEQDAPAEEQDAPVEEQDAPIEEQDAPAEEQDAPAEEQDAPVEEQDAPIEEQDAPAEEQDAPVEEQDSPAEEQDAPAEEQDAPAEEQDAPVEEQDAAVEEQDAPAPEDVSETELEINE